MNINNLSVALTAALLLGTVPYAHADEANTDVTWLGKNNMSWTDSEVWDSATPEAWQTAIINYSSLSSSRRGMGRLSFPILLSVPMFRQRSSAPIPRRPDTDSTFLFRK